MKAIVSVNATHMSLPRRNPKYRAFLGIVAHIIAISKKANYRTFDVFAEQMHVQDVPGIILRDSLKKRCSCLKMRYHIINQKGAVDVISEIQQTASDLVVVVHHDDRFLYDVLLGLFSMAPTEELLPKEPPKGSGQILDLKTGKFKIVNGKK